MLTYTIRRLVLSVPTLLFIALVIFMLLELAPGDPMAQVPLTVPSDVKEQMRIALGLDKPSYVRFWKWLLQIFWIEPKVFIDYLTSSTTLFGWLPDTALYERCVGLSNLDTCDYRALSWQTRSPVVDLVLQRLPQTLWVVGTAYVVGILIALPIGIYSAYRQYSWFDQAGTFVSMIGFSVPPFFSGVLVIVIFSVQLGWFPSIYDTTHTVNDWDSFVVQLKQMILPVMVLALQITAQISRFMRASMLDNLNQDYVRTARAKGLGETTVVMVHVLRNSMIPVVTVIALGVPLIFGGAIITEQVFKVNGIGQMLIGAIQANDLPTVQTLTFVFAFLIVMFNLIADVLYGVLDPRIRYE
ncbi:ABC transporter permease [Pseudaestuariivita atlantica]|uniref:ABC transporter substrate-binding protein n=1 Tax=Pseudaestuariivita atlantica TaxID=1317121 RepID=A0A0L1JQG9_9RHOB|nr:ABC transporter permease [Pseudaestuariivita atlantica]KNG93975.1 ABC transporter substrate-binding protein [Pseudaestuariivita atlantica]